ncbi:VOC family protein [Dokdonella koreensis]|uniref:VOC family protein n=1 Tax=Dokdonella koreensis TaxID=323415 RepID=UPI0008353F84|nr:VOC family protein [Dokdonella koreensis]
MSGSDAGQSAARPVRPALLVNIDVPDLARAEAFYCAALDLRPGRRLGGGAVELLGADAPVYLLLQPPGGVAAADHRRDYGRHWTPVHLDFVVADLEAAVARAEAAGAVREGAIRPAAWGRIAQLADPFGHGLCLIAFSDRGYDAIALEDPAR